MRSDREGPIGPSAGTHGPAQPTSRKLGRRLSALGAAVITATLLAGVIALCVWLAHSVAKKVVKETLDEELAALVRVAVLQLDVSAHSKLTRPDSAMLSALREYTVAGRTVPIQTRPSGQWADFGTLCRDCPLRDACTKAKSAGRQINIHAKEATLARGRALHRAPQRRAKYNQTRPRVERKNAHLMRHRHGGRRSRMIGIEKTALDFSTLAAAHNLARLGVLFARDAASQRAA